MRPAENNKGAESPFQIEVFFLLTINASDLPKTCLSPPKAIQHGRGARPEQEDVF